MAEELYLKAARVLGEFDKIVRVPYRPHTRSIRCKDKSHPQQKTIVLIWYLFYEGVPLPQKAGLCTVCRKLFVIVGKEEEV